MRTRLALANQLDRFEARVRRVGEHCGWPQAWLAEWRRYREDPRLLLEEFWTHYALKRMAAQASFKGIKTPEDARQFYQSSEYPLYRQLVHRRHEPWRRVLWTMRGRRGVLWEFGAGVAPVTAYVRRFRPSWDYWLIDLPSPHLAFGQWRTMAPATDIIPQNPPAALEPHVITALDVFEHLEDPEAVARALLGWLRPGGLLHWNFIALNGRHVGDLDLATPASREQVLAMFARELVEVWATDEHRVSWKREGTR